MKTITVILMTLLLAAATSMAGPGGKWKRGCDGPEGRYFQRGDSQRHGGPGIQHLLKNADEVGLSEDQIAKLRRMATEFQLDQVDRKAAIKKAQIELKALARDDNSSVKEVNAAIDEVASLKATEHKARFAQRKAIHSLLSDAQIEKIKQFRKERRSNTKAQDEHSGHRGSHGEHGR